ncbi:MAG TPA: hypothetical protein VKR24_13425 [Candidatus Limnocylindrales bacterium]|nr:hypothetical protein [Candidatus Limnocylindrales bacterium]
MTGSTPDEYRPGVCNIGPAEITRRRRSGHIGLIVTVVVFLVLVALHVPPVLRLVVGLPAAGAASGYLQAALKFCAGFASKGVFNFGQLGQTHEVVDPEAHARDRSRANQILLASLAVGVVVAVIAAALPR